MNSKPKLRLMPKQKPNKPRMLRSKSRLLFSKPKKSARRKRLKLPHVLPRRRRNNSREQIEPSINFSRMKN